VQALDMPRAQRDGARRVVVVATEKIERTGGELGDAARRPGIDLARPHEEAMPTSPNSPLVKRGRNGRRAVGRR
jgi:hypothetical protein